MSESSGEGSVSERAHRVCEDACRGVSTVGVPAVLLVVPTVPTAPAIGKPLGREWRKPYLHGGRRCRDEVWCSF